MKNPHDKIISQTSMNVLEIGVPGIWHRVLVDFELQVFILVILSRITLHIISYKTGQIFVHF